MKLTNGLFLLLVIGLVSCSKPDPFLEFSTVEDYQEYLILYPETEYYSQALDSLFRLHEEGEYALPPEKVFGDDPRIIAPSTFISILINQKGEYLMKGEPYNASSITINFMAALQNRNNGYDLPKIKTEEYNGKSFHYTDHVIRIVHDAVQDKRRIYPALRNIFKIIHEYRSDISNQIFNKPYSKLKTNDRDFIIQLFKGRLWLNDPFPSPPPPPPPVN